MVSLTGQQIITIHIFPNILRSKVSQTMKIGQFIENGMRNIFLEKSYTRCDEEASPRTFSKKSEFSKSLDQQPEMLSRLLLLHVQVEFYQKYIKFKVLPLAFT